MMKIKKLTKKLYEQQPPLPSIERVIYEEAQELARQRKWSVSFTLSFMWSQFKGAGDIKKAEAAFVLMQREEEGKGKRDPIFAEW
jgi:hypothetical protein